VDLHGFQFGLGGVALLSDVQSRSISAENPDGAKGAAARALPEDWPQGAPASALGKGWKVRPLVHIPAGETYTMADIAGPGMIQQIWCTIDPKAYRDCILRMYWDEEPTPSVEVPLGDFFCCGHSLHANVASLPIAVNPLGGFNSYWPLPFRKHARITLENQSTQPSPSFYYQVNYALADIPQDAAYFHAQWRRAMGTRECPEHVILDGIRGKGQYVGTYLAWVQLSDGWWGEGEIKFFIDGDGGYPTICGTGTEDYFGGAWCFGDTYSTAFLGYPLRQREGGCVPKHGLYRWHIMDPIRFDQDLKVTIQELGWWPNGKFQPLTDDISSTGYWYQFEPHAPFPQMPPAHERWTR